MTKLLFIVASILVFTGCGTIHYTDKQSTSASYLADDRSYELEDIIVSVKNKKGEMTNLHVSFTAVVNQKEKFVSSGTYSELNGLIRRLETRIKANLIKKAIALDVGYISDSKRLHKVLADEAQSIFDTEYNKWKKSSYFDVKIEITSFYFTDLSVGKAVNCRTWW